MPAVADVAGFACYEVEFKKDGSLVNPADKDGAVQFLNDRTVTDLFVCSHGWNTNIDDARKLYSDFFAKARDQRDNAGVGDRHFGILAILWPSMRFADRKLIPGGTAAGLGSEMPTEVLEEQIDRLKKGFAGEQGFFDRGDATAILDQAMKLTPDLEDNPDARAQFVNLVRSLVEQRPGNDEDAAADFFSLPDDQCLKRLWSPTDRPAWPAGEAWQPGSAAPLPGASATTIAA